MQPVDAEQHAGMSGVTRVLPFQKHFQPYPAALKASRSTLRSPGQQECLHMPEDIRATPGTLMT